MSEKRKPKNETEEERIVRTSKLQVSNFSTRGEKTAWMRKRNNLSKFVTDHIHPLEQELWTLRQSLQPLYDEIAKLREDMVESCIHPFDELRYDKETGTVTCTFCDKTFKDKTFKSEE